MVDDLPTGRRLRRLPLHAVPGEGGCRPIRRRIFRQVQRFESWRVKVQLNLRDECLCSIRQWMSGHRPVV